MQGDSGFIHTRSIQDLNDEAAEKFPATLIDGHLIHVFKRDGEWHVWMNTENIEFDGLCLGIGATRDVAVAQAVRALEAAASFLQGPA